MLKCVWIGIGITIPDESDLFTKCCSVSKTLADKYQSTKRIDKFNPPHINLYDLDVPYGNLDIIADKLDNALRDIPGFEIEIRDIEIFHFGAVYLSIKKSMSLNNLQENIVNIVSPLKKDCICSDYLKLNRKYSDGQKEMLKLHGNPFVLYEFTPHITVGFLRNIPPNVNKSFTGLILKTKFYVDKIHLRWQKNIPNQPVQDYRDYQLATS